ncbi:ABC transporter permease [Rubrimonas sp.]|uniref:ABC transporter permease n=1 Tax=Rubrimonas sp. TaxID=2036015 RepID=UPI002FDD54AF
MRPGAPRRESFAAAQLRLLAALIVRETYTRFGRDNIGFAWIVMEPVLFCLAVIALWSSAMSKGGAHDIPIVAFLLTGYMPLQMYRHGVMHLMRCMHVNAELLYHRQITVLLMYAARLVTELIGTLGAFVITVTLFVLWGLAKPPVDIPMIVAGFLVYMLFVIGFSILIGALSERFELVEKLWPPLGYITVPLSGTFYMLYWLPPEARDILVWFPLVSGVEMIRGGYFGPDVPVFYEWEAAVVTSLVLLAVGLFLLRSARRYVEAS